MSNKLYLIILIPFFTAVTAFTCPPDIDITGPEGEYTADWKSLDSRPAPDWYTDAKFGIFIHWGVYSVPAYAPRGAYAEWYLKHLMRGFTWFHMKTNDPQVHKYHREKYGRNYKYENFVEGFTAENYDPTKWAELFERSGAKYIALTSKHHEGFTLWPNKHASEIRNMPWNALEAGPKRDLLGELAAEVKKTSVRFGVYYSLCEWANKTYDLNRSKYIHEYMIPQFQELVRKYEPDLIFSDGEWDMHSVSWKSRYLLAWLYNNYSEIVVNDRWGFETRHKHGTYYTTEYGSGMADDSHPWEENRGIGWSYGYNANEKAEDYRSTQELILMLVDIVSRGGNLLLNIGPKADGTIPEIQQQRLIEIGEWLDKYGEAIYGTKMWNTPCQWSSDGKAKEFSRGKFGGKYEILEQTVNPAPGAAVKEVFFTTKGKNLYLIIPVKNTEKKIVIRNTENISPESAEIPGSGNVKIEATGENLIINYAEADLQESNLPFVIKLNNAL